MNKVAQKMPTAHIAVNKGRLKMYNKKSDMPTFYLQKGQEFQIELFNPTTNNVKAVISLNGNKISQGGLVLRPGERVFLERYLDIEKKFKFDTYEVANTSEVKEAIKENGDFTVEFFNEDTSVPFYFPYNDYWYYNNTGVYGSAGLNSPTLGVGHHQTLTSGANDNFVGQALNASLELNSSNDTLSMSNNRGQAMKSRSLKSKKMETGRVEMGSHSNQNLQQVDMKFYSWSFHKIEYKLLPISQKVNTTNDINVVRYCVECGTKQKPNFKFCPNCGTKA